MKKDELRELFQETLDMPEQARIELAQKSAHNITMAMLEDGYDEKQIVYALAATFKLFCSADRNVNDAEYNLWLRITGLNQSPQEFFDMVNCGSDPKYVKAYTDLYKTFSAETKSDLCVLGLCICANDNTMTASEQQLLADLLES